MTLSNSSLLGIFFSSTLQALTIILIIILLVVGLSIYSKYPEIARSINMVIVVGVAILGSLSFYNIYNYFTANSLTIGEFIDSVVNISKPNEDISNVSDVLKWHYKTLGFSYVEDNTYSSTITTVNNSLLDLKHKDYYLYLNGREFNKTQIFKGDKRYLQSEYIYSFYNDSSLILQDTLYVSIYDYDNYETIILTTKGGESAVKLWQAFEKKFGFELELKTTSTAEDLDLTSSLPIVDDYSKKMIDDFKLNYVGSYYRETYSLEKVKDTTEYFKLSITDDCYVDNVLKYINVDCNISGKTLNSVGENVDIPNQSGLYSIEFDYKGLYLQSPFDLVLWSVQKIRFYKTSVGYTYLKYDYYDDFSNFYATSVEFSSYDLSENSISSAISLYSNKDLVLNSYLDNEICNIGSISFDYNNKTTEVNSNNLDIHYNSIMSVADFEVRVIDDLTCINLGFYSYNTGSEIDSKHGGCYVWICFDNEKNAFIRTSGVNSSKNVVVTPL